MTGARMMRSIGLLSVVTLLLVGCSKASEPAASPKANTVSVSVHGVNYTANPFRYVLVDAKNPSNGTGGGEHIGPFGGGGTSCCLTLPERWMPGIQVKIHSTHWLPKTAEGNFPEVAKTYIVDIPSYPEGDAGELWVLRTAEGTAELVMSNVEPDHPQWPGKVKGWPEPSLAYQRERWELHRRLAESSVEALQSSLKELQTRKEAHLQEAWDVLKEYRPSDIKNFSGPDDPAFAEDQKEKYVEALRNAEEELTQLLREKP